MKNCTKFDVNQIILEWVTKDQSRGFLLGLATHYHETWLLSLIKYNLEEIIGNDMKIN